MIVDIDQLQADGAQEPDAWCPLCPYRLSDHRPTTSGDVTTWRCPSEAELREDYGK